MKKINPFVEIPIVVFCISFLSTVLLHFLTPMLLYCVLCSLLCVALTACYIVFLRPRIENALAGTYCENTQADAYCREDESEVTEVEV